MCFHVSSQDMGRSAPLLALLSISLKKGKKVQSIIYIYIYVCVCVCICVNRVKLISNRTFKMSSEVTFAYVISNSSKKKSCLVAKFSVKSQESDPPIRELAVTMETEFAPKKLISHRPLPWSIANVIKSASIDSQTTSILEWCNEYFI